MIINPSQAWSILHRHAAETNVKSIRLSELRTHHDTNNNQTDGFITVHNNSNSSTPNNGNDNHDIIVDWSRNRVTLETIQHLLRLCAAMDIREKIYDLAWGKLAPGSRLRHPPCNNSNVVGGEYGGSNFMSVNPTVSFANDLDFTRGTSIYQQSNTESRGEDDEEGGSMHLSLRAPANQGLMMRDPYDDDTRNNAKKYSGGRSDKKKQNCKNALDEIHNEWKRIQSLTESIRMGKVRGASNKPLVDVIVISGGGNDSVVTHSLEFVYTALLQNEQGEIATCVDDSSLLSVKVEDNIGSGVSTTKNTLLQSTADGVINMVKEGISTPFKKKSSQSNLRGGLASSQTKKTNRHIYRKRRLKVLSSTDPSAFNEVLSELCPATTMVITLDLELEKEKECKVITSAIRDWLVSDLLETSSSSSSKDSGRSKEAIVQKHMYLVTCNDLLKKSNANAFLLPRHSRVEAFCTFSAAGLLPLSLVFGWDITSSFISGAHDVDRHFVDTTPRHNLPIILALLDLWNDEFLQSKGKVISPYMLSFGSYPGLVASIENKVTSGRKTTSAKQPSHRGRKEGPTPVIASSLCCDNRCTTEFITTMQLSDSRMCSLLAHADTLAFGNASNGGRRFEMPSPGSPPTIQRSDSMLSQTSINGSGETNTCMGNQPSTLILCGGACDAFTCGQLIALSEHRALVKAWLWNMDPFIPSKTSTTQDERQEQLTNKLTQMNKLLSTGENLDEGSLFPYNEEANGKGIHSTTKTILKKYAMHHNV